MPIEVSLGIDHIEVKSVELKYKVKLPDDYVDFLTKHNGMFIGHDAYCMIPLPKVDDGEIAFQEIFGINTINPNFDLMIQNQYSDEIMVFDNPFIIGSDPGGNFFVLNCNANDDAVYYWDRTHIHYDNGFDYQEVDEEGNIYKVSDSFTDFYDVIMLNVGGDVNVIKKQL